MTATPDTPIMDAAKRLATFDDARLNQRIIGLVVAIQQEAETREREGLARGVSSGVDMLAVVRVLAEIKEQQEANGRELKLKGELIAELLQRMSAIEGKVQTLRDEVMRLRSELSAVRQAAPVDTLSYRDHVVRVIDDHRAWTLERLAHIEARLGDVEKLLRPPEPSDDP